MRFWNIKRKKFVSANIKRKEGLIENKVSFIKEKVKKHKKYLNQKFKKYHRKKNRWKNRNLRNNDKFRILDKKTKLRIIQKDYNKSKNENKKNRKWIYKNFWDS